MDYEILEKNEDKEYQIKTELTKEQIQEKILHHFYFLKEQENLEKFYGEYNVEKKTKFEKEEEDEDEYGDIMLTIWGKIIKFLLEDILHCFYITISDIIKYTTINNTKPKAIQKIMQELRFHFQYISKSDVHSNKFYEDNFPDLCPKTGGVMNIFSFFSFSNNFCREEKNQKNENESVKKSIRKDLSKDEEILENSILFNYEIFKTHCDCFLMVITDILEDNDANVIKLDDLINNIKENYVENERNKSRGQFKLRYGTDYLNETMCYLENIKKIKIFIIKDHEKEIKFVKVLKNKDDHENNEDIEEAKNILDMQNQAQQRKFY